MNISGIYKKYITPPNLQNHLLLVTKIVLAICDHWKSKKLNRETLLKAALLHDLANIVKFDFVNHPEFLGSEIKNLQFWIGQQKIIKDK